MNIFYYFNIRAVWKPPSRFSGCRRDKLFILFSFILANFIFPIQHLIYQSSRFTRPWRAWLSAVPAYFEKLSDISDLQETSLAVFLSMYSLGLELCCCWKLISIFFNLKEDMTLRFPEVTSQDFLVYSLFQLEMLFIYLAYYLSDSNCPYNVKFLLLLSSVDCRELFRPSSLKYTLLRRIYFDFLSVILWNILFSAYLLDGNRHLQAPRRKPCFTLSCQSRALQLCSLLLFLTKHYLSQYLQLRQFRVSNIKYLFTKQSRGESVQKLGAWLTSISHGLNELSTRMSNPNTQKQTDYCCCQSWIRVFLQQADIFLWADIMVLTMMPSICSQSAATSQPILARLAMTAVIDLLCPKKSQSATLFCTKQGLDLLIAQLVR